MARRARNSDGRLVGHVRSTTAAPGLAARRIRAYTFGMLRIDNLSKRYGDHFVFKGLTHSFPPGCVALCEEESTGKSSLLDIIAGVIAPDVGDVWIDGHSVIQTPLQAKARMAYVPDDCLAFPTQTGRGWLEQAASEKNATL